MKETKLIKITTYLDCESSGQNNFKVGTGFIKELQDMYTEKYIDKNGKEKTKVHIHSMKLDYDGKSVDYIQE